MQRLVNIRRIDPHKRVSLQPIPCEICSEPASVELLVDMESVIAACRCCDACLPSMQL